MLALSACTPQDLPATGNTIEPTQAVQAEPSVTPLMATEAPTAFPTEAPATPTMVKPTESSTITPSPAPTLASSPTTASQGERASVSIANDRFTPRELTVEAGTTVVWTLNSGIHTVTSDDGLFQSDALEPGQTFEFTFDEPGTYPYYCEFHGGPGGVGMSGVIMVEE